MKKALKWIGRVLALLLIAGFFVPSFTVSCGADIDLSMSNLAFGVTEYDIGGTMWLIAALIIPILLLVLYFVLGRSKIGLGISSLILTGADLCLILYVRHGVMREAESYGCVFSTRIGFFLNLVCLGALAVISILIMFAKDTRRGSVRPNARYIPPGGGVIPPDNSDFRAPLLGGMPPSGEPVASGWTCPICGTDNEDSYHFCLGCGSTRPAPQPKPEPAPQPRNAFCTNCGAAIVPGSRFCSNCGTLTGE